MGAPFFDARFCPAPDFPDAGMPKNPIFAASLATERTPSAKTSFRLKARCSAQSTKPTLTVSCLDGVQPASSQFQFLECRVFRPSKHPRDRRRALATYSFWLHRRVFDLPSEIRKGIAVPSEVFRRMNDWIRMSFMVKAAWKTREQ
jgi:hypothetical protein